MPRTNTQKFNRDQTNQLRLVRPATDRQLQLRHVSTPDQRASPALCAHTVRPHQGDECGALEWGETPQTPPLRETRYAKTLNSPFRMVIFDTQSPRCARGLDNG